MTPVMRFLRLITSVRLARRRLAGDGGFALAEVVMGAAVLSAVTIGVMASIDVSAKVSGNQKSKAVAANVAEEEMERIRGLRIDDAAALNGTPTTRVVGGATYTITSTAAWVANAQGENLTCQVIGGNTYLRLSTSVSWQGSNRPVRLDSILAPGARNVVRNLGSLTIRILDVNGSPVSGVGVTLTATGQSNRTGTTDSNGCVVWSTIPVGTWQMTGTRSNYLVPSGASSVTDEINVVGQTITTKQYEYSAGARISGSFFSIRPSNGENAASAPQRYVLTHPSRTPSVQVIDIGGATTFTTPLIYPYPSGYMIWAGGCTSAPPATWTRTTTVTQGQTATGQTVRLPAWDARVQRDGGNRSGALVRTTLCGTTYDRWTGTNPNGQLPDFGYPYSSSSANRCINLDGARMWTSGSNTGDSWATHNLTTYWECTAWSPFGWCLFGSWVERTNSPWAWGGC